MNRRIVNVSALLPEGIVADTSITIEDGVIAAIGQPSDLSEHDGAGCLVVPGAVDLHCDALEKLIETRPGVHMPQQHIMPQADRLYAAAGVTTIYHAISFADNELGVRSVAHAKAIAEDVAQWRPYGAVDHRFHARYEVSDVGGYQPLLELIDAGKVDMVSVMDHRPGQGQFQTFEAFGNYYGRTYKLDEAALHALAESKHASAEQGWARAGELIQHAHRRGLAVASHDDDCQERVDFIHAAGGTISEFPINLETAAAATAAGLTTIMGAPNIVRGGSQSGNMRALDAVHAGVLSGLCADYVPWTMLAAAFALPEHSELDLVGAMDLVAGAPARAVGLDDRGVIDVGRRADLVQIALVRGQPQVVATWCAGREAFRSDPPLVEPWVATPHMVG